MNPHGKRLDASVLGYLAAYKWFHFWCNTLRTSTKLRQAVNIHIFKRDPSFPKTNKIDSGNRENKIKNFLINEAIYFPCYPFHFFNKKFTVSDRCCRWIIAILSIVINNMVPSNSNYKQGAAALILCPFESNIQSFSFLIDFQKFQKTKLFHQNQSFTMLRHSSHWKKKFN